MLHVNLLEFQTEGEASCCFKYFSLFGNILAFLGSCSMLTDRVWKVDANKLFFTFKCLPYWYLFCFRF
jgi:hypothetical protein